MVEPFLSIVMPIFNAEKFLRRSIESILAQEFTDFELILVDDRSTDDSLKVCRSIADARIKIIGLEKNSGASAARNAALDVINGRYVTFVDADDWLDPDAFTRVTEILRADPTIDCVKVGCSEDYIDDAQLKYRRLCRVEDRRFEGRESIAREIVELETVPLFGYVWNGFYRAEIVRSRHIRFDEARRVNEDFFFNAEFFRWASVLRTLDVTSYHYEKRGVGSLSSEARNFSYAINRQKIEALLALFEGEIPSEAAEKIFWLYTRFCYAALVDGENLSTLHSDPVFARFRQTNFRAVGLKQKLLIGLLQKKMFLPLLFAAVKLIGGIKRSAPTLFARLKR